MIFMIAKKSSYQTKINMEVLVTYNANPPRSTNAELFKPVGKYIKFYEEAVIHVFIFMHMASRGFVGMP